MVCYGSFPQRQDYPIAFPTKEDKARTRAVIAWNRACFDGDPWGYTRGFKQSFGACVVTPGRCGT